MGTKWCLLYIYALLNKSVIIKKAPLSKIFTFQTMWPNNVISPDELVNAVLCLLRWNLYDLKGSQVGNRSISCCEGT
jgi:hypothetical protein